MHAELRLGGGCFMLTEENVECGHKGPQTLGGSPVFMIFYVADANAAFEKALAAGARELRPLQDQFYGDRSGTLVDPFGYAWSLATHIEDVAPQEMEKRMAKMMSEQAG